MNVLMLGNGFDINYQLLTKYINFLNTVSYISTVPLSGIDTVGSIVGASKLQSMDEKIAESYEQYKVAYDKTPFEKDDVEKLDELAKNNYFFSYLRKAFNRDAGWIDFEKEIAVIIQAFKNFFAQMELRDELKFDIYRCPESMIEQHVIQHFDFFYRETAYGAYVKGVKEEYLHQYPYNSIDKEKIIDTLESQLLELAEGLRIYLKCFVENVVEEMCKLKCLKQFPALMNAKHIVTFNYTNTYERLYGNGDAYHIHGNVDDRIILGVNPDEDDEVKTLDVSFLRFKKYFQRVVRHSDTQYLDWLTKKPSSVSLLVMGHSLDVTDRDIITQMFDIAQEISVMYHSESVKATLVTNLIKIYGKTQFDELRLKKKLRFLPQDASYTDFAEDRQSKRMAGMEQMMGVITTGSKWRR